MPTYYDLPETIQTRSNLEAALGRLSCDLYGDGERVTAIWDDLTFYILPIARQIEIPDGFSPDRLGQLQATLAAYRQESKRTKTYKRLRNMITNLDGANVADLTNNDLRLLVIMMAHRLEWLTENDAGDLVVSIPDGWQRRR